MKVYRASSDDPKYPFQIVVACNEGEDQKASVALHLPSHRKDNIFFGETALEKAIAHAIYLTAREMLILLGMVSEQIVNRNWPTTITPESHIFEKEQLGNLLEKTRAIAVTLVKFLEETGVRMDDLVQTDRIVPDADLIRSPSNIRDIQEWILEATKTLTTMQAIAGLQINNRTERTNTPVFCIPPV